MRRVATLGPSTAVLALACGLLPGSVLASGFQLVEQNGSGLGYAYSGQAAGVRDASAIFFNPAALTGIEGRQLVLSVEGIGPSDRFTDSSSSPPYLPTSPPFPLPISLGGAGGEAGSWTPVPNGYFSWQAGSQWWVGLGVNIPFGLTTEWDASWLGRFHAVKSSIKTVNINPTVAVKLGDSLSLGAGVSYQRLSAELTQHLAYGGTSFGAAAQAGGPAAAGGILAQLGGPAGLALEGPVDMNADSWAWGWNAGLLLRLGENGRLGASYRSKVKHDLEGDVTFTGAPTFVESGPLGPIGAGLNAEFANGPVTASVDLPDTVSVALAFTGEKVDVLADWTWTGWSSIPSLDIFRASGSELSSVPLKFEDSWRAGLGLGFQLNEHWKLRLGTAYDKTPVQDLYRTPRLPDQNRVWAAGGFEWKVGGKSAIDLGYAHLFMKDASSELPNQSSASDPPSGTIVGTYQATVNIVSLQYRVSF
jgi:long-chain fatty acid transport protein